MTQKCPSSHPLSAPEPKRIPPLWCTASSLPKDRSFGDLMEERGVLKFPPRAMNLEKWVLGGSVGNKPDDLR